MIPLSEKVRLDVLLVRTGRAPTREKARRLIMSGVVRVDGRRIDKPGTNVAEGCNIEIEEGLPHVSRGGLKLERALDFFSIDVRGKVALDVGASTGGFTDCLLQRGAAHVYALDVGYGQLAWELRNDERVTVMERKNVRYLTLADLTRPVDVVVVDVSFISVRRFLHVLREVIRDGGTLLILVKPQFEAGREEVGKGGIVREPGVHREVLFAVAGEAGERGFRFGGVTYSPIRGAKGNVEYLIYLTASSERDTTSRGDLATLVEKTVAEAHEVLGVPWR